MACTHAPDLPFTLFPFSVSSLRGNRLENKAKKAITKAAGERIELSL